MLQLFNSMSETSFTYFVQFPSPLFTREYAYVRTGKPQKDSKYDQIYGIASSFGTMQKFLAQKKKKHDGI